MQSFHPSCPEKGHDKQPYEPKSGSWLHLRILEYHSLKTQQKSVHQKGLQDYTVKVTKTQTIDCKFVLIFVLRSMVSTTQLINFLTSHLKVFKAS